MSLLLLAPDLPQVLLATIALRATVILLAAWLLARLLHRAAAATRHAVWTVALASLLLLPVVSAVAPRWSLVADDAAGPVPTSVSALPLMSSVPADVPSHDHAALVSNAPQRSRGPLLPATLFVLAWALGTAFGLGRLSAGWAAARRLVRRSTRLDHGRAAATVAELARRLGINRPVGVALSHTLTVPVNCGLVRPVILLPEAATAWSDERLRVVLLHELAHVRRWDYASLLVMEAVRALYWFNPLVWLAARRANIELERACDDEVLRAGTRSIEYAEHLYQIAAALAGARAPSGALAMAQPSTLRARVGSILAASMNRSPLHWRALAGAAALALLVGLPLASIQLLGEGRDAAERRAAVRALGSDDAVVRARAALDLGQRGADDARPALIEHLADVDPTVRGMAAWALGRLGDRAARAALTGALQDSVASVREMAVAALGTLEDRRAVPDLARLTRDPEMGVRGVLTAALQQIGGAEAGAVLADLVRHDPDEHVRDMSTWALRETLGRDAVPALIDALRDSVGHVRAMAARNLYDVPDPRAFDALVTAATTDPVRQVRVSASYSLGALEDARAAEPLTMVLRDSAWNVRAAAAGALARVPGSRAADALIAATRDPVHQVRLTAIESLSERKP